MTHALNMPFDSFEDARVQLQALTDALDLTNNQGAPSTTVYFMDFVADFWGSPYSYLADTYSDKMSEYDFYRLAETRFPILDITPMRILKVLLTELQEFNEGYNGDE